MGGCGVILPGVSPSFAVDCVACARNHPGIVVLRKHHRYFFLDLMYLAVCKQELYVEWQRLVVIFLSSPIIL